MFILELEFLTGRFYGATTTDREESEWPPHPSRVFTALVATHHQMGAAREEREALQWLEVQPSPKIAASIASQRDVTKVYVPVNDTSLNLVTKGRDTFFYLNQTTLLPDCRTKKERFFPSATPIHSTVHYIWDGKPDDRLRDTLSRLCKNVASVGHSASLARLAVVEKAPSPNFIPDARGRIQLRTPVAGQFEALGEAFTQHEGIRPRTLPTGFTSYRTQGNAERSEPKSSIWSQDWLVLRIKDPVTLRGALAVSEALRAALMALGPQPSPAWISGHEPDGSPSQDPHLAVAPLSDVGHRHSRGFVMGLAVVLPSSLTLQNRASVQSILRELSCLRTQGREFRVEFTDGPAERWTLDAETWMAPSTTWASVTPVVFDRYPKDPFGQEAQDVVRRAASHVGLPEPDEVALAPASPLHGVPLSREFPARHKPGKPRRWHVHVILRFPEPVRGPVLLGAGRHHGYGLFRPWNPS